MIHRSIAARALAFRDEVAEALGEETPDPLDAQEGGAPDAGLEALLDELQILAGRSRSPAVPTRLEVGQIWTIVPSGKGLAALALLTHVEGFSLRGVLISDRLWLACEEDVVLAADASPTGEALAVHLWRDVPVARRSLGGFVGEVPRGAMAPVLMLLQAKFDPDFARAREPGMAADVGENEHDSGLLVRWTLTTPRGGRVGFVTGEPIDDPDDPRIEARSLLRAATRHVEDAALATAEQESDEASSVDLGAGERIWRRILDRLGKTSPAPTVPTALVGAGLISASGAFSGLNLLGKGLLPALGAVRALLGNAPAHDAPQFECAVPFTTNVGGLFVELELLVEDAALTISAVAMDARSAPVAGVQLVVLVSSAEGTVVQRAERFTNQDGVIDGCSVGIATDLTYCLHVMHASDRSTLSF